MMASADMFYADLANPTRVMHMYNHRSSEVTSLYYDLQGHIITMKLSSGEEYYVACDNTGTPRAIFSSQGEIIKEDQYTPCVDIYQDSNPSFHFIIGFHGGLYDPFTNLIHFGRRDCDVVAGRWTTPDYNLWTELSANPKPFNLYTFKNNISQWEILRSSLNSLQFEQHILKPRSVLKPLPGRDLADGHKILLINGVASADIIGVASKDIQCLATIIHGAVYLEGLHYTIDGQNTHHFIRLRQLEEDLIVISGTGGCVLENGVNVTVTDDINGKGRELADMMERRKVDILCVQETRWKGSKARSIGAGFKLFYYGVDSKRNGVGVVLKEEFVRNVLEVKRVSDRVMSLKLEIEGVMLNVVSGYAPQVGCELEEKERFWSELDEVMESIPTGERVVIGADFNGHVGEGNTGDEEVMGKFGVKERNLEGQMVVDFAKRMDMAVVNTYFQKREEHRVTYKSGGRRTQVDYILCRRGNLKEISDCKVVVGESVARQHRMVVCRMTLMVCKKKRSKIEIEKKTKWWKLKKEECCEEFRQKLRQALGGQVVLPDDWETTAEVIRETGRKVLGVSSGRRKEDKETWWWNEEVQDSIQRKRLAKKKWDMDRTEENRQEYKELQRRVKREVSKAKQKAYDELYTRLDTREGEKDLYRLARQRDRDGKDVQQVRVIKDRDGRVLTSEESVQRRWKEYFEELMNEENEREKRVEGVNSVEQKVDKIRKDEVRKALKRMKSGKAVGPDDIPVEVWKCLGEAAVEFLASLFNRVLESERMPEEWRRSVLVPIFKNKGDVQSCSNYRGIKLMSHTMKLWERVVEARLRKVVEICEQQYGFMPRKSTTDAIFALRILMEKYRDGQRELHCVFVDLEKAYDRVPREELWYCMRKSGVAEKYVRVVQDMYERSRTVVRCAVGQTEEFNVEVGLHQGSALSPFLFAIVMDQLSEEVRQESPWTMMFADDIVICSESREQVEENLERWRFALERRGMKVSRSKTEYMCVNEREGSGTVRLQGEEVKKVQEFKYLGSTVQSNGECGKEVKKRVQAGWNGWRKVSGVLCDRKISARIKGKVYRTVVRPAMLYGLETVSLRKRQESELEVAELKMLRFSLGVTRLDRIRNKYIRGTAHVGRLGDKVREARLRWFGHVQRRESEYIGRRMLDMELPGRRQRGRPKRRYMDGINEDMKLVGASVEDAEDRDRWREMIRCGDP
ncbi:hypothetical protein QTP70_016913 [Hemibagrus guttatus]|uniref:ribonuclease H n=1 Tax=Hemibagrus guttatus TaxID=175788 RepID=A0AAE0QY48_9TELE|nr:hypothetical protein QTP70_016913 [Hemibagrus guttatus]